MAPKSPSKAASPQKAAGRQPDGSAKGAKAKPTDYTSHGVTDNDILMLPSSDYQILGVLTVVAAIVRIFRIYQPSSVVFDEVQ